jgi:hypothetical protein
MGTFEVTCARRTDCKAGGHVSSVGLTHKKRNAQVDVSVARFILSAGDIMYVRLPKTGDRIQLSKGKCACGSKTVRLDAADTKALERLPSCA